MCDYDRSSQWKIEEPRHPAGVIALDESSVQQGIAVFTGWLGHQRARMTRGAVQQAGPLALVLTADRIE